ncbi:MAG: hypothetical protein BWY73_01466 [candidate division TA06 bacterium ADurb.Bin417]|uniref:Uncharacterized protein n=1 Tax=candidate division TA06 bacterium ADurb.Bin417 TaxID=1852828 RepID=A0A1V5M8S9_UNCT6|nr:MAG: hypothetical protein BWY73_01466 [candidate division TA06 bacterium ADurb.Bin417]
MIPAPLAAARTKTETVNGQVLDVPKDQADRQSAGRQAGLRFPSQFELGQGEGRRLPAAVQRINNILQGQTPDRVPGPAAEVTGPAGPGADVAQNQVLDRRLPPPAGGKHEWHLRLDHQVGETQAADGGPGRFEIAVAGKEVEPGPAVLDDQSRDEAIADFAGADAHPDRVAGRTQDAVAHHDILAGQGVGAERPGVRPDGQAVVAGVDQAVGDQDVPAAVDVDPVAVGCLRRVFDPEAVDPDIPAAVEKESPIRRVEQGNALHPDPVGTAEVDQLAGPPGEGLPIPLGTG